MRILITGANRGIGAAMLSAAQARGINALGTTRAANHPNLLPLDVRDPQSCAALADQLDGTPLDLLVCNAGVYLERGKAFDELTDPALWADTFAANVTGVYLAAMAFQTHLKAAPAPKIAIIASQMGSTTRAKGNSPIYRASKAAAINLGKNLAVTLQQDGIAVGIYHPGWVRTDMGTQSADIDVATSAEGLLDRFEALELAKTGCFENYDGTPIPY